MRRSEKPRTHGTAPRGRITLTILFTLSALLLPRPSLQLPCTSDSDCPSTEAVCNGSNVCEDCAADIDGDGTVGVNDMLNLIANFGPCSGCAADVDGDGIVGVNDILIVLSAWGPCH